ncbi:MAG: polyprenyl synthetase family protein [Halanaerobiaceae bacterium]
MERFQPIIDELNNFILDYCQTKRTILNITVDDLIKGGGKRLRPVLLMLAGGFGDGSSNSKKLLPLAAGIELLHMATLVHDDIIDEAKLRRGQITAQERFGKNVAVFVGDYLLTKSYSLLSENLSKHTLLKLNKIVRLVCVGEIDQFEEKFDINITIKNYLRRIRRKTALLFAISTYIGGYESGVRAKHLHLLYNFALEMGMAFQIRDDLLDFTGDEIKTGKKVGQDLSAGIYTLPVICLLRDNDHKDNIACILKKETLKSEDIMKISQMVKESTALDDSKEIARKFLKKSMDNLEQLPQIKAKTDIKYIVDRQLKRQK